MNSEQNALQRIEHPFEPVVDDASRVLILGSFPSRLSRANRFYYGNPRNRFWNVVAAVCRDGHGSPGPASDASIAVKRKFLLDNGIALWDVAKRCEIEGSSDATIRSVVPNDIPSLLASRDISAIFANGRRAAELYLRYLEEVCGRPCTTLPSTSPANAAWSEERLEEAWTEALGPYLRPTADPGSTPSDTALPTSP